MQTAPHSYFDEAYFQEGFKRGTAYVNYLEGARKSPTYHEIAAAIQAVFQPRRTLEIGCATGIIVRHLNELGCEAYGIDVSEWAVRNAEHHNVILSAADDLPFSGHSFDLVYSCHAIEHLPDETFDRSVSEINRVCSGFQFHLLPMLGTPPYEGDPEETRCRLRKDPTHRQLHERSWWVDRFVRSSNLETDVCIFLGNETESAELSVGQFIIRKTHIDPVDVVRRSLEWNRKVFRSVQLILGRQKVTSHWIERKSSLLYTDRAWNEVAHSLDPGNTIDLSGKCFSLVVIVEGNTCHLRFAAGQDSNDKVYSDVAEYHLVAPPGCSTFQFSTSDMRILRGTPDFARISRMSLGGENEHTSIQFYFADQDGLSIL